MMNRTRDLIINSLEYYDKNNEKYNSINSKIKYYSLKYSDNDLQHAEIIFYDSNKAEIFRSKYEIIGIYNNYSNTWTWGWSIPFLAKNTVYTSRKILNYGLDIPPSTETQFLKTELITSRFRISNHTQLDLHVSIASYLSKIPLVVKIPVHPIMASQYKEGDVIKLDKSVYNYPNYQVYYYFILDHQKISG
jgi:hypothetical protein